MRGNRSLFVAGVALAGMVGLLAFGATDAAAGRGGEPGAFKVNTFACSNGGTSVQVDITGLGNQNICVDGAINVDPANCACQSNSGSCPQAANKSSTQVTIDVSLVVEPKNGRVNTTVGPTTLNVICTEQGLQCGTGQTPTFVSGTASTAWAVCKTSLPAGEECSCDSATGSDLIQGSATGSCGPTSLTGDPGRKNSCLNLFTP
jgi:hypothetical protein